MSKAKTIWDKSMSSRKRYSSTQSMTAECGRWSERAEWYSDMPLDIYAMCGLTDFVTSSSLKKNTDTSTTMHISTPPKKRRTFSSCRSCMT